MGDRYSAVNAEWPAELPALSAQEAISAAKRLWKIGTGQKFPGPVKLTSGNRFTWPRSRVLYVNPSRRGAHHDGWRGLVHDLSHAIHRRVNPGNKPHHHSHAWIEKTLIAHVVSRGWLDGKLRREEAPQADPRAKRQAQVLAGIARWESKLKRAENALRKLRKQARYYERTLGGVS